MRFVDPHVTAQPDQEDAYDAYLHKMCDFTAWLLQHRYRVRILQGDTRYDGPVRQDLRTRLEKRGFRYDDVGILDEDISSVEDLLTQLAQVDVVVSPRFHNLILGFMLNKPAISISYDPKSDALLEAFGLGKYCQPICNLTVDALVAQFLELEAKVEEIRPLLRERAEQYRNLLDEQYRSVLADL
jgi:polysaccharide pyruvyl transferase WcaK-like protein